MSIDYSIDVISKDRVHIPNGRVKNDPEWGLIIADKIVDEDCDLASLKSIHHLHLIVRKMSNLVTELLSLGLANPVAGGHFDTN